MMTYAIGNWLKYQPNKRKKESAEMMFLCPVAG
jgi:hypothetical protein